jgi:subtilisin-like proprotein convertase family protein
LAIERLEVRVVPSGLNFVGNWNEGYDYADVWGEGNFAYIGHRSGEQGMDIIDISNPSQPVLAAIFKGTGDNNLRDQEVQNNIGFFGSNNAKTGGIYVVDLHDPYHPKQLAFITPAMGALPSLHSIGVDGNYLYETDGGTPNIAVFDISNPSQPKYVRTLVSPSGGPYHEVTPENGRLYATVLNTPGYTDIWDISNVGNTSVPVPLLSETVTGAGSHTAWPTDDGNYLVISHEISGGTESIWDIHDPAHPRLVSTIPPLPTTQAFSSHQPMIKGNLLYTSWYQAGMFVYDISDPTDPVLVGNYNTYGLPVTGTYQGNWGVYAFLGNDRLLASDMSNGLFVLSLPQVSISGTIFTDSNGNGVLDPGEPGEAGQTVYVDTNNNGVLDPGEPMAVTDANGNYSITGLQPGAYRVREVVPAGYTQTTANPTPISGALDGTSVTGVSFGNFQLASVSGTAFMDNNGNGQLSAGKAAAAGQTVFLDQNHDGVPDQASTTVYSSTPKKAIPGNGGSIYAYAAADGFVTPITKITVTLNITFSYDSDLVIWLISPWAQRVLLVFREGGSGTNFNGAVLDDAATKSISAGTAPFSGTFRPEQPLAVLDGQNPNGVWTLEVSNESLNDVGTLNSWWITFTTAEPTTTTDANGSYSFTGLTPGFYSVREAMPANWVPTTFNPAPVTVGTSGATTTGVNFGNFVTGTISGNIYNDANASGTQSAGDSSLAGQTVFLDQNQNGVEGPFTLNVGSQDTVRPIPDIGSVTSNLLASGFVGVITQLTLTINITHSYDQDLIVNLVSPTGTTVNLVNRRGGSGQNFVKTSFSDASTTPIANGVAPFHAWFRPEQPLADLNGQSPNGTWLLQVSDVAALDSGSITGWSITFTTTEPTAQTDSNGNYTFSGLGLGTYIPRLVVAQGWAVTSGNSLPEKIGASGLALPGVNFGAYQTGAVSGTVFNDVNGNGIQDPGDTGLAGQTVFLDQNGDSIPDTYAAAFASSGPSQGIPDVGTLTTGLLVTGLAGTITNLGVTLNIVHPFDQDLVIYLVSPAGTKVLLVNREGGSGQNYTGTLLSDQATTLISQGTAPFSGSYQPEQPLATFNGQNADGTWQLETSDVAPKDVGSLTSWSLSFTLAEPSAQTDANGNYTFAGLLPGSYTVRTVTPAGWVPTTPNPPAATLSQEGTSATGLNFGRFRLITLSGTVYTDTNGNGVQDSGEVGEPGQTVFLDLNGTRVLAPNDPTATTDANGQFAFTNFGPGTYTVRQVVPAGWVQDTANPAPIPASSGVNISGVSFGNYQPITLSGTVYTDTNGNGVQDAGELGLAGQTVFLDLNGTGALAQNDPTTTTDANGHYSFAGLAPGTYQVRQVVPAGWMLTSVTPYPLTVTSGASVSGLGFGDFQLVTLSGTVYTDTNGNGVQDAGEAGLAGQTVYLDQNQNATLDQDSTGVGSLSQNVPLAIPAGGVLYSNLLAEGFAAPIARIGVSMNISYPSDGDLTISLITPWGAKILLVNQRGGTGPNFTQTILSDTATVPIANGVAPFTGRFLPEQPLASVIGQNPNGNWKLQIVDGSGVNTGSLIGWSITFFTAEPSVQTDANGNFTFSGLGPGSYTVRELPAAGWGVTSANPIVTAVTTSGSAVSGVAFGAYQLGTLSGTVFNDLNSNGVQDSGEPGLAGRTVFLDPDEDGVLGSYSATITSSGPKQTIPDRATLTTGLTVTGQVGTISNLNVTLNIAQQYDRDLIIYLVSPTGNPILLVNRRGGSGPNFTGTTLSDQASTPISQGTAPFSGSYQPEQPLAAVKSQSPNGTWLLEITDVSGGDIGSLTNWSLAFTLTEPAVQTDANGHYSFTGLFPGSYTVHAVVPIGWKATSPSSLTFTVSTSGTTLANETFGQMQPIGTVTPSLGASPSSPEGQDSSQPFLWSGPVFHAAASKARSDDIRLLDEVFSTSSDRFDPAALHLVFRSR